MLILIQFSYVFFLWMSRMSRVCLKIIPWIRQGISRNQQAVLARHASVGDLSSGFGSKEGFRKMQFSHCLYYLYTVYISIYNIILYINYRRSYDSHVWYLMLDEFKWLFFNLLVLQAWMCQASERRPQCQIWEVDESIVTHRLWSCRSLSHWGKWWQTWQTSHANSPLLILRQERARTKPMV